MDCLVDLVDVELAGVVAANRVGDVLDESCQLGLVVGRDERACNPPGLLLARAASMSRGFDAERSAAVPRHREVDFRLASGSFTPSRYDDAISRLEAIGAGAPAGRLYHVALETDGQIQVLRCATVSYLSGADT